MRIGGRDFRNQFILMLGQGQAVEIHSLTLPLVGENNRYVSLLRQSGRGGGIRTRIVLNIRVWRLGSYGLEGRSRKPYVLLPCSPAFARRHDCISSRGIDLG